MKVFNFIFYNMNLQLTWVREETIWSLEMVTAALASLGGAKRASSEMVVEVGNDM